ncbi:MAG: hypothetical protein GXZ03_09730 [Proteiniphilum sp.]|nr:hypothetical protein [Proteiniphilum sp.]
MSVFACETCGATIPEGKQKCEYCGSVYVFSHEKNSLVIDGILCDSCNTKNPIETNYCLECGNKLTQTCTSCGTKFSKFSNHCPSCGKYIKNDSKSSGSAHTLEDYYSLVQNSDFSKAEKAFITLEKKYTENPRFISNAITFYTKWGMSFDDDYTMINYSRKYRDKAESIISNLEKELLNDHEVKNAISFYKKNENIKTKKKEGCFIATQVYGSYYSPQVLVLRSWRDETLLKNFLGKSFVRFYYFISPKILFIFKIKVVKEFTKMVLDKFTNLLSQKLDNDNRRGV